jgi:hypothetical protein
MVGPPVSSLQSASAMFVGWTLLAIAMWVAPLPEVPSRRFVRVGFVGVAVLQLVNLWLAWRRTC